MSDVIGESDYPKVRVLHETRLGDIEDKINDLYARGFRLRGRVDYNYTGSSHGTTGNQFTATMVKED